MQKFGLKSSQTSRYWSKYPSGTSALETEIIKEQASALGRAGRKLGTLLDRYQGLKNSAELKGEREALLTLITEAVWALQLQREFLGFIDGNLEWIQRHYSIPNRALRQIGILNQHK